MKANYEICKKCKHFHKSEYTPVVFCYVERALPIGRAIHQDKRYLDMSGRETQEVPVQMYESIRFPVKCPYLLEHLIIENPGTSRGKGENQ